MFTPYITITARQLNLEVDFRVHCLSSDIERIRNPGYDPEFDLHLDADCHTELLIIDEADRLKTSGLEQLRDFFDRRDLGMILIGMPGFDRQLARYPQLYSRIGFAHQYRPLDPEDFPVVLAHYWQQLGLPFDPDTTDDAEAANAITRITGGNFRLIERLMSQVARVLEINQLDLITPTSSTPPDKPSSSDPSSAKHFERTVPNNSKVHRRTPSPLRSGKSGGSGRRSLAGIGRPRPTDTDAPSRPFSPGPYRPVGCQDSDPTGGPSGPGPSVRRTASSRVVPAGRCRCAAR
jgi:hypothetical protein